MRKRKGVNGLGKLRFKIWVTRIVAQKGYEAGGKPCLRNSSDWKGKRSRCLGHEKAFLLWEGGFINRSVATPIKTNAGERKLRPEGERGRVSEVQRTKETDQTERRDLIKTPD